MHDASIGDFGTKAKCKIEEATQWLQATARERAAQHGKRLFRVVYSEKPRMPVRGGPSRSASIAGSRRTGDEVIVEAVTEDGWVKVSRDLDTYAAYQNWDGGKTEMWMLTQGDDVGVLLHEVVLDGEGREIDSDKWAPDLV